MYRRISGAWVLLGAGGIAPDTTAPTVPPNLREVTAQTTSSSFIAAHDASSDTGSGMNRYEWQIGAGAWASNALALQRTFSGLAADTAYTVSVRAVDNAGNISASRSVSIRTALANPNPGTSLFAGHIPNRAFVGMATPDDGSNSNPGWAEALRILNQPVYESRSYTQGVYSASSLASMLARADAAGAYPNLSFKPGTYTNVTNGSTDTTLAALANAAKARRTAGPGGTPMPFAMGYHHEPAGDSAGTLAEWAAMQIYCCWYFAGRRGGTPTSPYVAANDVSDIMAWAPIGNGFWWRASAAGSADAAAAYPQALIDALRINRGILQADFYDADYVNQSGAMTNPALRTPGTGVRTSVRIRNFITWARNHHSGALGCGEFGVIDGAEMTACWQVIRANRDIWGVATYFNSMVNSDHDWRCIPANYPAGNPTSSKGLVDFGGDAQSAGRLAAFKTMLTESTSAAYTSPL